MIGEKKKKKTEGDNRFEYQITRHDAYVCQNAQTDIAKKEKRLDLYEGGHSRCTRHV